MRYVFFAVCVISISLASCNKKSGGKSPSPQPPPTDGTNLLSCDGYTFVEGFSDPMALTKLVKDQKEVFKGKSLVEIKGIVRNGCRG